MSGSLIALLILALLTVLDWLHDPRKLRVGLLLFVTLLYGAALALRLFISSAQAAMGVYLAELSTWLALLIILATVLGVAALGVALVLNGVTLLKAEGFAPAHTLSLLLGMGILGYLGAGIYTVFTGRQLAFAFLLLIALPLGWFGYGLVAYVGYSAVYGAYTRRFGGPVDAVVVLGAGVPDGEVRPLLASRIRRGIEWMDRDHDRGGRAVLVMSGGQGSDEPIPEGQAMAQWAVTRGVDPGWILIEAASTTTEENLRYSALELRRRTLTGPVAVVTSSYHAFRAATLMRSLAIPGYAIGARTARYYVPSAMLREYVAILRDHKAINIIALLFLSMPVLIMTAVHLTR